MPVTLPWPRPPKTKEMFDRLWSGFEDKYEKVASQTDRVAKAIYDKMVEMNANEGNYIGDYEDRYGARKLTQLEGDFDLRAIAETAIAEARE